MVEGHLLIKIELSHLCVMGLVSQSGAFSLTWCVVLYLSCCSPRPSLMQDCTSMWCLLTDWPTDWMDGHGFSLWWRWLIDALSLVCLHGTMYPMTDLYYTHYNWLLYSMTPPYLIATVLGLQYYSHWTFMISYNTIPTSSCIGITIPMIVEVTYGPIWSLATMYK